MTGVFIDGPLAGQKFGIAKNVDPTYYHIIEDVVRIAEPRVASMTQVLTARYQVDAVSSEPSRLRRENNEPYAYMLFQGYEWR